MVEDWSHYVGGYSVWLVRNQEEAYRLLLQVLALADQEPLLLPANATHALVEAVKKSGAKPRFGELSPDLKMASSQSTRIAWLQPPLGLPVADDGMAEVTVLDYSDSAPQRAADTTSPLFRADVALFGLHLSSDPQNSGVLLVFQNETLYVRFRSRNEQVEPAICAQAARQLKRLSSLAGHQTTALEMVSTGLQQAAGLPILPLFGGGALAHGAAVRIPDEGNPATFWTYARAENTPVQWLPLLRPVHYAAIASHPATISNLERWIVVPISPGFDEEIQMQAVLGIVKTAEYLGLRWWTDRERAAHYADLLTAMYGSDHDAYRPAFAIDATPTAEQIFQAEDMVGLSCSI